MLKLNYFNKKLSTNFMISTEGSLLVLILEEYIHGRDWS